MATSTLVREKFKAILAQAREKHEEDWAAAADLTDDLYQKRGRSDPILTRGGRTWFIEMDTCYGHSEDRLSIVPGRERRAGEEESSSSESESETVDGKALFKSAVAKARLLNIAGLMMNTSSSAAKSSAKASSSTVGVNNKGSSLASLIEEDDDPDPALNIPIFVPLRHQAAPPPRVEIEAEEAAEQQRTRQQRRGSAFASQAPPAPRSSADGDSKIDAAAIASVQSEENENNSLIEDDDDDLLEGFGTRPQKKTVHVRKFVRRNKFLKKVFRRGHGNSQADNVEIDDNYYA